MQTEDHARLRVALGEDGDQGVGIFEAPRQLLDDAHRDLGLARDHALEARGIELEQGARRPGPWPWRCAACR